MHTHTVESVAGRPMGRKYTIQVMTGTYHHADHSADGAECDGFRCELCEDGSLGGADGLANTNFSGSLGDGYEH